MELLRRYLAVFLLLSNPCLAQKNVAVYSFKQNLNRFNSPSSLRGFTAMFTSSLASNPDITVLERQNLSDIAFEMALRQSGIITGADSVEMELDFGGADFVIGGEITQTGHERYRIDVFIREVSTAKVCTEKISGNIEAFPGQASAMLAKNTAVLITGNGNIIKKKIIPKIPVTAIFATSLAGIGAGAYLLTKGERTYSDEYGKNDMPLDKFGETYEKAQFLSSGGIFLLGVSGCSMIVSGIMAVSSRPGRTLIRE